MLSRPDSVLTSHTCWIVRASRAPAETVIKRHAAVSPTWGVQQPGHLAKVGDVLLAVLGAAGDGADLVHGGAVRQLRHRVLFWAVAHHRGLHLQVVRHNGPHFVLCGEKKSHNNGPLVCKCFPQCQNTIELHGPWCFPCTDVEES